MNFSLLFLLLFVSSCGVKGEPSSPKGQNIPSVLDNYKEIKVNQPLKEDQIQ